TDLFTTLTGTVTEVDRNGRADSNGAKLYDVTVEITNPGSLSPGMKTQVTVQTAAGTETGLSAGTLTWAETTTVRALTGGTVTKLLVDENSYVRKGQLLVSLSNDSLVSQIASQELRVEQARLALAQVEQQQAETKIYAPWDGIVYLSQASSTISGSSNSSSATTSASINGSGNLQVGDEVKSGQTLATLLSPSLQVVVPVDETDIGKIKIGQKAEITVDAYPERKFAGTVTEIAAQGTVQNKVASFDVTLVMDDTTGLKAGMTANVEILVEDKKDALMLPIEAIIERGDRKFVRTEAGSLQAVETGLYNETMIEIKNGLKEGDRVVLPEVVRKNNSNQQPRFPGAGGPPGGMR
ncbi:MAG: efflux RND transporter periplasmic adaptor subunit, partial [Bacillota bacterium]